MADHLALKVSSGDDEIDAITSSMPIHEPLPNGGNMLIDKMDHTSHEFTTSVVDDEFDRPISPLHMPTGQIDGLEALSSDAFMKTRGQSPRRRSSGTSSPLHLNIPRFPTNADLAISAMQYLPYPLLVLSSLKTMVLANEAMARLLGIDDERDRASDDGISVTDKLRGQTLSQLGIDMLQDGRPVWVAWEVFLDSLADEMGMHTGDGADPGEESGEGDVTPTAERSEPLSRRASTTRNQSVVHDAVVEVVITTDNVPPGYFGRADQRHHEGKHTFAKMIITVWEIEEQKFYTMTFTSTDSAQTSLLSSRGQSRQVTKAQNLAGSAATSTGSGSHSSPSSVSSGRSSNAGGSSASSAITSPTTISMCT